MNAQFFDNFKRENKDDLEYALVERCRKNGWFVTDEDWLGIIADDKYYCLGNPSAPIDEIIETETSEHELTDEESLAEEIFHAAGETFYVIV